MSYQETISDLENKLYSLHPKAKELYNLINGLKSFSDIQIAPLTEVKNTPKHVFDKHAPVTRKIIFALKFLNRVAKVGEIEECIKEYEPDFDKGFSTPLRVLKEDNVIDTINPTGSNRDVYYGLKEWFNENGDLKSQYDIFEIY